MEDVNNLIIKLKSEGWRVRRKAATALGDTNNKAAVKPLIEVLKNDENPRVKKSVAIALGKIGDPIAVEPLGEALEKGDYWLQIAAADALGDIGVPAIETLIKSIKDDKHWRGNIIIAACRGLERIKDIGALKPMIVALKDENINLRSAAAKLLSNLESPKAVKPLLCALNDRSIRREVVIALGKIKDVRSIKPLIAILDDDNSDAQLETIECLMQIRWSFLGGFINIKDPRAVNAIKKYHNKRIHSLINDKNGYQLREEWDTTKEFLLNDINSREYDAIEKALFAFIGIGKEEIIPVLINNLNSNGNKTMAEAYLNCGHPELANAAQKWAETHGYTIKLGEGAHPVTWGSW